MQLKDEDVKLIRSAFPDEAIQAKKVVRSPKDGKAFKVFTGFKPQFIVERLNDCFGHGGWNFEVIKLEMTDGCAWCLGRLTIVMRAPSEGLTTTLKESTFTIKEQVGSCEYNKSYISYGDALKGAVTNCLEKCASLLDVGHEAYKGLVQPTEAALLLAGVSPDEVETNKKESDLEPLKNQLKTLCTENKIGKEAFAVLTKTVLGEEKEPKALEAEELKKLIAHVKTNKAPF